MGSDSLQPLEKHFLDFLKTLKKTVTQEFGDRDTELVEKFLFEKLPVQIHYELLTASKSETIVEEIKKLIQRRF